MKQKNGKSALSNFEKSNYFILSYLLTKNIWHIFLCNQRVNKYCIFSLYFLFIKIALYAFKLAKFLHSFYYNIFSIKSRLAYKFQPTKNGQNLESRHLLTFEQTIFTEPNDTKNAIKKFFKYFDYTLYQEI